MSGDPRHVMARFVYERMHLAAPLWWGCPTITKALALASVVVAVVDRVWRPFPSLGGLFWLIAPWACLALAAEVFVAYFRPGQAPSAASATAAIVGLLLGTSHVVAAYAAWKLWWTTTPPAVHPSLVGLSGLWWAWCALSVDTGVLYTWWSRSTGA